VANLPTLMELFEDSYRQQDIPGFFYVLIRFRKDEHGQNLANQVLDGVQGISASGKITLIHGFVRDALIQMPGSQVAQENNLTRVMYDNPHYLVSNNFAAGKRLYQKRSAYDFIDQIFLRSSDINNRTGPLHYYTDTFSYNMYQHKDYWNNANPRNFNDFMRLLLNAPVIEKNTKRNQEELFSKIPQFTQEVWDRLREIGSLYSSESEWIVKNGKLKIPSGSRLIVTLNDPSIAKTYLSSGQLPDNVKGDHYLQQYDLEKLNLIKKYNLESIYKISFSDYKSVEKINQRYMMRQFSQ